MKLYLLLAVCSLSLAVEVKVEKDGDDINSEFLGESALNVLASEVELRDGSKTAVHKKDDLQYVVEQKKRILDMLADENGLLVFPQSDPEQSPYFSGDLLLTKEQMTSIHNDMRNKMARRKKRTVHMEGIQKWPDNLIFYDLDKKIFENEQLIANIRKALNWWSKQTCIDFEMGRPEEGEPYLLFTSKETCASYLGMIGGQQPLHVGGECGTPGIISHLVGHALGLTHEHQRFDRDHHILVQWDNIKSNFLDAFAACDNCESHDVPYDMGSVMHMKAQAFSHNDMHTVDTDFTWPGEPSIHTGTIGSRRQGPTYYDIRKVNRMYCDAKCPKPGKYDFTSYGGYWNPKYDNCSVANCPEGFYGDMCQAIQNGKPTHCGALITVRDSWETFETPNYPEQFNTEQHCSWMLYARKGHVVQLEFEDEPFDLIQSEPCDFNFVEVRAGHDLKTTGLRFCGDKESMPREPIVSVTNKMLVFLRATDPGVKNKGFRAKAKSLGGPTVAPSTTRSKDDPFPDCEDDLPTKRCVSMYQDKDKCSVPKAKKMCKRTCNYCESPTTPATVECRDDLSSANCVDHYLLKEECNSFRAKKRCRETCGHCEAEDRCRVQKELCPQAPEDAKCANEVFSEWCQSCDRCKEGGDEKSTTKSAEGTTTFSGECRDRMDQDACVYEMMAYLNCTGSDSHRCPETCGLCQVDDECRLQKLYCPDQMGKEGLCKREVRSRMRPNIMAWCGKCGFCGGRTPVTSRTNKPTRAPATSKATTVEAVAPTDKPNPTCQDGGEDPTGDCLMIVLGNNNCTGDIQSCFETCGVCKNPDPCRLQRSNCELFCEIGTESQLEWCQKCDMCMDSKPKTTSGGNKPTEVPVDPNCEDGNVYSTCIFEALVNNCTGIDQGISRGCQETCGTCLHPNPCRLQDRHCPTEGEQAEDLCNSGQTAHVAWCQKCGYCPQKTAPVLLCEGNECPDDTQCIPEPKACVKAPCHQYRCVPVLAPPDAQVMAKTTRRWRAATKAPSDPNCKDESDIATCMSEVLGPYNCKSPDNILCKETCRLCNHPDPCRLQKDRCWDGTLCAAGGNFRTWCDQCAQCSDGESKGPFESVDPFLF